MHFGWADLCEYPKCGYLGSVIFDRRDCVRAVPEQSQGRTRRGEQRRGGNRAGVSKRGKEKKKKKKRRWSDCFGRADTRLPLPGAIPRLLTAGTFGCWVNPPGPVRPSLANLGSSDSSKVSMPTASFVRTPSHHDPPRSGSPSLKPSSSPGLQGSWITGVRHDSRPG